MTVRPALLRLLGFFLSQQPAYDAAYPVLLLLLLLRIVLLLAVRGLLLLSTESSQQALYPIALLPAFSAEKSGEAARERSRIARCRQQTVQLHVCELLHIGSDDRVIQVSCNDDGNY